MLAITMGLCCTSAWAAGIDYNKPGIYEGTCGPTSVWSYDVKGLKKQNAMTISGSGLAGVPYKINGSDRELEFSDFVNTTSLVIEDGITDVMNLSMFQFITSLYIPGTMTEIREDAFDGGIGLNSLTLGEGVTTIGAKAFLSGSLTNVTIPRSVTTIGDYAFGYRVWGLNDDPQPIPGFSICGYIGTAAETYARENGFIFQPLDRMGPYYETDRGTCGNNTTWVTDWDDDGTCVMTIFGSGAITGNFVNELGDEFVNKDRVASVIINGDITSIESGAFKGFTYMDYIVIPGTVKTIGEKAFYNCSSLRAVNIQYGVVKILSNAFLGCNNLHNLYVPYSVNVIKAGAIGYKSLNNKRYTKNRDFVSIYGHYGSYADVYAHKYGFDFEPTGYLSRPSKTKITSLKAEKGKKIQVKWDKKVTGTGYQFQYSLNKKFDDAKTVNIPSYKTTSYTVKRLKSKKRYYFRIRTVKGSVHSDWSGTRSIKTK